MIFDEVAAHGVGWAGGLLGLGWHAAIEETIVWQILAVLLLVSSPTILGQDSYDRFLIPLYVRPVIAAYGTIWTVETWVMNSGIEPIRVLSEISACRVGGMGIGQMPSPSPPLQLDPVTDTRMDCDRRRLVRVDVEQQAAADGVLETAQSPD